MQDVALFAHENSPFPTVVAFEFHIIRAWGTQPSIRPGELERRHAAACRELEANNRGHGKGLVHDLFVIVSGRCLHCNSVDLVELHGPDRRVQDVTAHVSQGAAAEVEPAPPLEGKIGRMIGSIPGRSQPEVPIQSLGDRRPVRRTLHVDGKGRTTRGAAAPGVDLANVTDGAGPDPLADPTDLFGGVALIAHLGLHSLLACGFGESTHLAERMGQGLFAVDMLAHLDRPHGGHRMGMVRGGHDDRIDRLVHVIQHDAKIFIPLGLGELFKAACRPYVVHVTEGHDVFAPAAIDIGTAPPATADHGDIEFAAGGIGSQYMGGDHGKGGD